MAISYATQEELKEALQEVLKGRHFIATIVINGSEITFEDEKEIEEVECDCKDKLITVECPHCDKEFHEYLYEHLD